MNFSYCTPNARLLLSLLYKQQKNKQKNNYQLNSPAISALYALIHFLESPT